MRDCRRVLLGIVASLACASAPATAQSLVMLDLGAETAILTPDVVIELPLTVTTPGQGPVSVSMDIGFPAALLKFMEVQPGTSLTIAKGEVKADKKPMKEGETEQVVSLQIKAGQPLTAGTVVTMSFGPTADTKPNSEVHIRNISRTVTGADGKPMQNRGTDGMITLLEPPAPCFFYMH